MTTVVHSHQVLVYAPLQAVFDYVSDLTRHPEWSSGELKIEAVTPGPVAAGKEYFSRGEFAVQKDRPNTVRISEVQPPYAFGFVAHDPSVGNVSHLFTFSEEQGGVRVTRTMTVDLNPFAAFFFRFFIYPWIGSPSMEKSLAALKARLEGQLR